MRPGQIQLDNEEPCAAARGSSKEKALKAWGLMPTSLN
jgi:hypothetical protein